MILLESRFLLFFLVCFVLSFRLVLILLATAVSCLQNCSTTGLIRYFVSFLTGHLVAINNQAF